MSPTSKHHALGTFRKYGVKHSGSQNDESSHWARLTPARKEPSSLCIGGLRGPKTDLDAVAKTKLLNPTGDGSPALYLVTTHSTGWGISTRISFNNYVGLYPLCPTLMSFSWYAVNEFFRMFSPTLSMCLVYHNILFFIICTLFTLPTAISVRSLHH
jgi:hypothetical protein